MINFPAKSATRPAKPAARPEDVLRIITGYEVRPNETNTDPTVVSSIVTIFYEDLDLNEIINEIRTELGLELD